MSFTLAEFQKARVLARRSGPTNLAGVLLHSRTTSTQCRSAAAYDLGDHLQHFGMNRAVGGQDRRATQFIGIAVQIADGSAGFLNEDDSRRGVPRLQAKFPEPVKAASGYVCQIEGRRTVAAHAMRSKSEIPVVVNVGISHPLMVGKSGAQQTLLQVRDLGAA